VPSPGPRRVGVRLSRRPPPAAVPTGAVRGPGGPRPQPPIGPHRGGGHGDGAAGPGGPVGPRGDQRVAARYRLEGCLWAAPGRRGVPPDGAGVLASAAAGLGSAAADLCGGPPGGRATGVLAGRGRRVLDSTLLEDAVATQDTVTSWSRRSVGSGGWSQAPARSSWPPTTTSGLASRSVPGMTRRPPRRWCRGWSATRWRCWPRSARRRRTTSRPRRWRCWPWWPAKTSSRASGPGRGGWPGGLPKTGSSPPSTHKPAMATRPVRTGAMASRPTSPPSQRPGSSPSAR
jgi:hypothetical protein